MSDNEAGGVAADKKRRGRPKKPEAVEKPAPVKRKASSGGESAAKKPRGRPKGGKKRGRKPKSKKVDKSEQDGDE